MDRPAGGAAGETAGEAAGGTTDGEPEPTPVVIHVLAEATIRETLRLSTTIEAERQVRLHAESTGRVVDLRVEEGQDVKRGQELARIRFDAQANGLERAEASLAKAERDLDIANRLRERNVASSVELETARLAVRTATIDLRDRQRDLQNTKVLSPLAGTLTERVVNEGAFVTSGAHLFTVTDFSSLVARVYVPERELDRVQVGQKAQLEGRLLAARRGVGTVVRLAPVVDAATGTVKVTVAVPPAIAGPKGFVPGMFAEVTITTKERAGALVVPKRAIVQESERSYVYVLSPDRARVRRVELIRGTEEPEVVESVGSTLRAGEQVVLSGHAGLDEGARVRVVDAG